jgi:hypothetical protein
VKHLAVAVVGLLLVAANGFAQDPDEALPQQPPPAPADRTLMLDPTAVAQRQKGLVAFASVFQAYDTYQFVGLADPASGADPITARLPPGVYTAVTGGLSYTFDRSGDRGAFGVNGRSGVTYFPSRDSTFPSAALSANVSRRIGSRTAIDASPTISYSSFYDLGLFPGIGGGGFGSGVGGDGGFSGGGFGSGLPGGGFATGFDGTSANPNLDSAASATPFFQYGISTGLNHQLAAHTNVALTYAQRLADLGDRGTRLNDRSIGGHLFHSVSPHFGLRFGYTRQQASFGNNTAPFQTHDIDAGVDYRRALSFSRRATVTFGTGSSLITRGGANVQTQANRTDLRILGNANLDYHLGQTWSARLAYRRDWQFVEGFAAPFFIDAVTVGIGGSMTPRAALGASMSYVTGQMGSGGLADVKSYQGVAFLQSSLTRTVAAYLQYQYFKSDFSPDVTLPAGYPYRFIRNGVRAGLSLTLPLSR